MDNERQQAEKTKWQPPRGIAFIKFTDGRAKSFGVQWRSSGKRKTKTFAKAGQQIEFAKGLTADVKRNGVAAYRLDEGEARDWRAFVAQLDGADIHDVLACWHRHGKKQDPLPLSDAVAAFMAAKEAEGVGKAALLHYKGVYARLTAAFAGREARTIEREEIAAWLDGLQIDGAPAADFTRRTHAVRVRTLFRWLVDNRKLDRSPCDGLRPVKITPEEVSILTIEHAKALFKKNSTNEDGTPVDSTRRELCGRLALEAFAGLRFSSAALVVPADIEGKGIVLPAAKIKTRRRQFIDGLPENLWAWLEWSGVASWSMTPRNYMREKSAAFIRADIPHPNNCLRHSFASYHMATNKDASRTAAILCHTSPKMLYLHYKARATEAAGAAYFQIMPTAKITQ